MTRQNHKIAKPSVLCYPRMINAATGFLFSNDCPSMDGAKLLSPEINTIRTVFNSSSAKKGEIEKEILKPQIFRNETALLPSGHEWLVAKTNLIVSAGDVGFMQCNSVEFGTMLDDFVSAYKEHGFKTLAEGYVLNMATGRWLWRNLTVALELEIHVSTNGETFKFTPNLGSHTSDAIPDSQKASYESLCKVFEDAMSSNNAQKFEFTAFVRIGEGQEVYPSQAFADKKEKDAGGLGKVLQTVTVGGEKQVILSPQKISNAMRMVDIWYGKGNEEVKPLAVEAYGIDKKVGIAHREANGNSLYKLLDQLPSITEEMKAGTMSGDAHYVMACLIRGGLYQQKS